MNDDKILQESTEEVEKQKLTALIDKSVFMELKLMALKKNTAMKYLVNDILKKYIEEEKEIEKNGKKRKTNRKSKTK
jgi:hypothetical protein